MRRYKNHFGSLVLALLTHLAAAVTVLVLGFLMSYVLVRGVPNLRPEMFALTYTSENQSMLPAIINSRLKRVVYGARDPKAGCCGSLTDLFALPFNHHPVMEQGLLEEEAQALLQEFFAGLRAKRLKLKAEKRAQQAAPLQNEENPHE